MASLPQLPSLTSPLGIALAGFGIFIILYTLDSLFFADPLPKGIALIREPPGARRFSFKTRLDFNKDGMSILKEAWEKYLKKGKPVIVPTIGPGSSFVMPPSSIRWIHSQPESVLSFTEAFLVFDRMYYSLGTEEFMRNNFHARLLKTFNLERLAEGIWDELPHCFEKRLGDVPGEWREIDVWETVRLMVVQLGSRITVGLPLCRNEEYIRTALGLVDGFMLNAFVGQVVPPILVPVACRIMSWPLKPKLRRLKTLFEPTWRERVELLKTDSHDNRPYDHLQLVMEYAQREKQDEFTDLDTMVGRLVTMNFGNMNLTGYHLTDIVLDLLGSDAEFNTVATLRDEFKRVLNSDGNRTTHWTKAKLANLIRTDSLGRETLRLHAMGARTLFRRVMVDNLKMEDGTVLPKGTMISLMSRMPQTDEETYEDPLKYDPFRFSRMRESASADEEKDDGKSTTSVSLVAISEDFLPFGHGKRACPGRFLLDLQFKMFLCYLVSHYDIEWPQEYNGKRPPNRVFSAVCMPPSGAKMRVKRRETPAV